jgi:hypothetical protein
MEKVFKNVNLLYIIHNDSVLMRRSTHQDYEVIDVFGFKDNDDAEESVKNKLTSLFGKTYPYNYYGKIESIINRKDVIVHIAIKAYKVLLDRKYEVLSNYTDDVVSDGYNVMWLPKNEIKNEKRFREGDKKVLTRIFDERNIDIKMIEDQGERWIDAKTTFFEDR